MCLEGTLQLASFQVPDLKSVKKNTHKLTLMVWSSLQESRTLYSGWKTTFITESRCPFSVSFSGGLGIQEAEDLRSLRGHSTRAV